MGQQTQAISVSVALPVQSNFPQAIVSGSLAVQSEARKGGGGGGALLPLPLDITFVLSMSHPAGSNAHWLGSCHLTTSSLGQVHSSGIHFIAMLATCHNTATQTRQTHHGPHSNRPLKIHF